MDDEISHAFQNLTPEQLIRESSAINEEQLAPARNQGSALWASWVDQALIALRMTARQRPIEHVQFSTLQNPTLRRYFLAEGDETVPMYADRLKREAKLMGATWFFNVMVAPGASHYEGEPEPYEVDPDDQEAVQAALENGRLSLCLCWHAEMREGDHYHERSGVIPIIGEELSAGTEGELSPDLNEFAGVLSAD